jgi:hypothetical protein
MATVLDPEEKHLTVKDVAQLAVWTVAIVGGLYGMWNGINESKAHRAQQATQLRWEQAELARQIIEKLSDNPKARSAMRILDWAGGREFDVKTGKQEMITVDDMIVGLRTKDLTFNDKETFVRDSFDELFDGFQLIEHYLRIQLISFDDVKEPLGYYVQRLDEHRDAVNNYLRVFDYGLAQAFIERFDHKSK